MDITTIIIGLVPVAILAVIVYFVAKKDSAKLEDMLAEMSEEEKQQWEERHKKVECHAGRAVDGSTLGEELDKIFKHIQQRQLGSREAHHLKEVVILIVPGS